MPPRPFPRVSDTSGCEAAPLLRGSGSVFAELELSEQRSADSRSATSAMDESIEVAQLVEASWGAAEPLGISLNRDLTIKELEASAAQKGLTAGMSLQTVGKKNVQGFAYDGVLAIIERNKKPGKKLVMTFGRGPPPAAAPAPEPERPRGASLPPGVDKSKVDFAALVKTGSTGRAAGGSGGPGRRDTWVRLADSGGAVEVDFPNDGPLGIHFSAKLPLRVVKIGERSMAASTSLQVGMALQGVGGHPVAGLGHAETLDRIRQSSRPLTLTFDPVVKLQPESAGAATSCAVVGSRLVEVEGFFARPYTVYTIASVVEGGVFEVDMRYSDICDWHEQWTAKLMSEALPLTLPDKNTSYAMKNTPEVVAERRAGIQQVRALSDRSPFPHIHFQADRLPFAHAVSRQLLPACGSAAEQGVRRCFPSLCARAGRGALDGAAGLPLVGHRRQVGLPPADRVFRERVRNRSSFSSGFLRKGRERAWVVLTGCFWRGAGTRCRTRCC